MDNPVIAGLGIIGYDASCSHSLSHKIHAKSFAQTGAVGSMVLSPSKLLFVHGLVLFCIFHHGLAIMLVVGIEFRVHELDDSHFLNINAKYDLSAGTIGNLKSRFV